MPISWAAALRLYGKSKGSFVLPKKGSSDYEAVKKLMSETEYGPEHEVKRRHRSPKRPHREPSPADVKGSRGKGKKMGQAEAPLESGVAPPAKMEVPPPATKPVDQEHKTARRRPKVKDAAEKPVKEEKKKVQRSGLTKKEETVEFLEDMNTGAGGALAPQFAGQGAAIKAKLKADKKTEKVVTVGEGEERTLEGMKTDDPQAISGKAPFSFQALRNKLLC